MVLKIDELPIVSHPHYDAWLQQEVYRIATEEGRSYRRAGFPISKCPNFRDNDLVISWKIGWRHEDERIRA